MGYPVGINFERAGNEPILSSSRATKTSRAPRDWGELLRLCEWCLVEVAEGAWTVWRGDGDGGGVGGENVG